MYTETRIRTVVKTLSWRITATIVTIIIVFMLTKNIKIAASIGGIEVVLKLIVYYLHERVWSRINMGKKSICNAQQVGAVKDDQSAF